MPTFGVDCTEAGKNRAMEVLEKYRKPEDKGKEAALIRIMEFADSEAIRGTHPQFEPLLRKTDETIAVLIKQINGIVAGIDNEVSDLKEQLNQVCSEKENALLKVRYLEQQIGEKENKYTDDLHKLSSELNATKREADNARVLADETSKYNSILIKQAESFKDKIAQNEELEAQIKLLKKTNADLEKQLLIVNVQLQQEQIISQNKEKSYTDTVARLESRIKELQKVQNEFADYKEAKSNEIVAMQKEYAEKEANLLKEMHKKEVEYLKSSKPTQ